MGNSLVKHKVVVKKEDMGFRDIYIEGDPQIIALILGEQFMHYSI